MAGLLLLAVSSLSGVAFGLLGPLAFAAALAALGLAWLAYAGPGVLFALYLTVPLYKATLQPHLPVDLTVVLAVLNAAQLLSLLGRPRPGTRPVVIAGWVAIAGLVVAGSMYAPDSGAAVWVAMSWVALVCVPLLAAIRVASSPRYVDQFVLTILGFAMLFTLGGLLSVFAGMSARLTMLGANTINTAIAVMIIPVTAGAYIGTGEHRGRGLVLFALSPGAVAVALATGSRGPLLFGVGLTVCLGAWAVARGRLANRGSLAIGAVGLAAAVGLLALGPTVPLPSLDRIDSLLAWTTSGGGDASVAQRQQLLEFGWWMFQTQPVLGWGTGAFNVLSSSITALADARYPHSLPMEFAATYGVVGLVAYGSLVAGAFRRGLTGDPVWRSVGVMLAYWLLCTLVSGGMYEERVVYGMLLLMALRPSAGHIVVSAATAPTSGVGATADAARALGWAATMNGARYPTAGRGIGQ